MTPRVEQLSFPAGDLFGSCIRFPHCEDETTDGDSVRDKPDRQSNGGVEVGREEADRYKYQRENNVHVPEDS